MKKQNWKVGKNFSYIVSDVMPERKSYDKHDFKVESDYYGGYLIAESIPDEEKSKIIAASLEMFEVLETIENDQNQVPEWLWKRIKSVLKKATDGE